MNKQERKYKHPLTGEFWDVDAELRDEWLDALNNLEISKSIRMYSVCAGHQVEHESGQVAKFEAFPHVQFMVPESWTMKKAERYAARLSRSLGENVRYIDLERRLMMIGGSCAYPIYSIRIFAHTLRQCMPQEEWEDWWARVIATLEVAKV